MASIVSSYRNADSLILRVPSDFPNAGFADIPQVNFALNKSLEWKKAKHFFDESLALKAVHDFTGDVLIVSSGKDRIVPPQTLANYLAARDGGKLTHIEMGESGHGLLTRKEINQFRDIVCESLGITP